MTRAFSDNVSVLLNQSSGLVILGDADGDGVFNNQDIASFVSALTNQKAYQTMFPDVDPDVVLDMNGDGEFDNLDIADFVASRTCGGTKKSKPDFKITRRCPSFRAARFVGR